MISDQGPDQILDTESYISTSTDGCVKLRLQDSPEILPISVPSLLEKAAKEAPEILALAVKREDKWIKWTYKEYLQEVRTVAKAFIALGLEPRKSVGIIGFNSPEWFIADLAAIFANSMATGIYSTNSPEMCKYMANHSNTNIIVVEDDSQLQKILAVKSELPDLKAIIQYTGKPKHEGVLSWQELLEKGKNESDEALDQRLKQVCINQCCHLVYTSGTTGPPKAAMLTHDNLTYTATCTTQAYQLKDKGQEKVVSYLPLSHIAASLMDIFVMMICQGSTYFADKGALKGTLTTTLKEVVPTLFFGVPRVYEKIQEKMLEVGRANKGLKKQIGQWAKKTGLEHNQNVLNGTGMSMSSELKYKIADKVVFQKVKTALGVQKCKSFFVAAAPISNETLAYFMSLDIRIFDIYGMSECAGPQTFNCKEYQKLGSIGRTLPGCQTKISTIGDGEEDSISGEILMQGRNVMMGYLNQPEKTDEAITKSGWLRSGDLGTVDDAGFFKITGRAKEILITAGGENIAPIPIEDSIKKYLPCVANAMLIGDQRKFLSVLLTLKTEIDPVTMEPLPELTPATLAWCEGLGSKAKTIDDILDPVDEIVEKAIQEGINLANNDSESNAKKVQKWRILRKDFSVPGGELGPTLKMKRHIVMKQYAELVDGFYN